MRALYTRYTLQAPMFFPDDAFDARGVLSLGIDGFYPDVPCDDTVQALVRPTMPYPLGGPMKRAISDVTDQWTTPIVRF